MNIMKKFLSLFTLVSCLLSCTSTSKQQQEEVWIPLFNGTDLSNWTPKFVGYEAGYNYNNTFRVEDGILKVSYSEYDSFRYEFGHLFTDEAFENYRLRSVYRFTSDPIPNAPAWAFRNNGFMLHSQSAASMLVNQNFPVSLEAQPLGGREGEEERPTMNLCTPGTNVVMGDSLHTVHCASSTSKTYRGDEWITVEMIVYGDSIIHHLVEGDTVMTYFSPSIGGDYLDDVDSTLFIVGTPLKRGHIAIQAESHDTEFRTIELLQLDR